MDTLKGEKRDHLIETLDKRYNSHRGFKQRVIYWRKKYTWIFVVEGAKLLKRVIDIVLSLFGLILLFPLLLLIALFIKLQDGGKVMYLSTRLGKWGRPFLFPKFRTMVLNADEIRPTLMLTPRKRFKLKDDPRITPLGKFLRKTSLDELPQLWCVLKGEMSLVGPRPPLPEEFAKYTLEERKRLEVPPGITCFWQISGRSEIPFEKQIQLDKEYIESHSMWVDFKILLKTIPAVIFGRGAY